MNNIYESTLLDQRTPSNNRIEGDEYAVVPLGTFRRQSILTPWKEKTKICLQLALVGLAISVALPIFAQQTNTPDTDKVRFKFQAITNANDPTFNQELGINNSGVIAGYFGSGAAGHPNKGYTVVRPYHA